MCGVGLITYQVTYAKSVLERKFLAATVDVWYTRVCGGYLVGRVYDALPFQGASNFYLVRHE
jgi:hypothetical protein